MYTEQAEIPSEKEPIGKFEVEGKELIRPSYDGSGLANIPPTILTLFGVATGRKTLYPEFYEGILKGDGPEKVILILIDSFGYNSWLRNSKDHVFFNVFNQRGRVSRLTSVFPATTSAAITSLNSGLTPQEHALFEMFMYLPERDRIIDTLRFRDFGDEERDSLQSKGVNPQVLFHGETIYQKLDQSGIRSFTISPYAGSVFSELIHKGSKAISFKDSPDLVVKLEERVREAEKSYTYIYLDGLDSIAHKYGPESEEYHRELSNISSSLEEAFLKQKNNMAGETLIIVTADHGQVRVTPGETIFLDEYRWLTDNLQENEKKMSIFPAGSLRDLFLHVKPEKLGEVNQLLSEELKGRAKVFRVDEMVEMGFFGVGVPSQEFISRAGNLVILPYQDSSIWYRYPGFEHHRSLEYRGHHGGLNEEEMTIPFAVAKLSDLR